MFENDYTINGIHATHLKYLVNDAKVFVRYIDVYMNAAIIGFLHGRSEKRDNSSQDRARIYADAFATERLTCDFIYRLIMLLDETSDLPSKQRLDRAFRNDSQKDCEHAKEVHEQNMELFHSYVFGGIEELYEQFTDGATSREDYINKIYDITTHFKEEIEGIDYEGKLKQLVNGN
jgi:hypothetical protein